MKYESQIINEILEQRGHELSSLHYQSECVETWIEEAKGAYPKLCDYESEWLNYISILDDTGGSEKPEPPIGEFPYETITTNSTATVNNVVPLAYKSAILKGSTKYRDIETGDILDTFDETKNLELVSVKMPVLTTSNCNNLFNLNGNINEYYDTMVVNESNNEIENGKLKTLALNTKSNGKGQRIKIKPNTTITVSAFVEGDNRGEMAINFPNTNNIWFGGSGLISKTIETKENTEMIISFKTCRYNYPAYFSKIQVEENVAKPTSDVKTNILTVNEEVTLRSNGDVYDELNLLTGRLTQRIDENNEVLSQEVVKSVDLTITNQDGETLSKIKPIEGTMIIKVTGELIAPTAILEVPIEANSNGTSSGTDNTQGEMTSKESRIGDGVSMASLADNYLTGASNDTTTTTNSSTQTATQNSNQSQKGNNTSSESYELLSQGNIGITSSAQLLKEWRDVLINIDEIIINDCKKLFMTIY